MLNNITLSQDGFEIILGALLGDAHLHKKQNCISILQSIKQKDYLLWKYEFFKEFNLNNPIKYYKSIEGYENIRFRITNKSKEYVSFIKTIRKLIYSDDKKKTITREYLNLLTPLSIAVWWMDDGCLSVHKGNRYGKLCTHCFNYNEHIVIKQYFKEKYDIDIQIKVEKNKYYFCRLNVENLKKLINLIYPYVIQVKSMIYKIDLNYHNNVNLGNYESVYNIIKKSLL